MVDTSRALQFAIDIAKVPFLLHHSLIRYLSFDEGKVAGESELKAFS